MRAWHGTRENFEDFRDGTTFFSTERSFAEDYAGPDGRVLRFEIPESGLLDTRDPESLRKLTGGMPITDPYDGAEYETAEEFIDAAGGDTWEAVETMIADAIALGYDGMIVTEGGEVNVALFRPDVAVPDPEDGPEP